RQSASATRGQEHPSGAYARRHHADAGRLRRVVVEVVARDGAPAPRIEDPIPGEPELAEPPGGERRMSVVALRVGAHVEHGTELARRRIEGAQLDFVVAAFVPAPRDPEPLSVADDDRIAIAERSAGDLDRRAEPVLVQRRQRDPDAPLVAAVRGRRPALEY